MHRATIADDDLTPREVALLAGVPKRVVEKAIEENVLVVRRRACNSRLGRHSERRHLGPESVVYVAAMRSMPLTLSGPGKRAFYNRVRKLGLEEAGKARIEIAPAIEADMGRLVGGAVERVRIYLRNRHEHIDVQPGIKGGTPVIRGTRMTVYAVAGRLDHGDSLDEVASDNPDLPRAALEAAVLYARAHPLVGRPGGRPWKVKAT
jgi:uncharacterized protein (DUF433 family)